MATIKQAASEFLSHKGVAVTGVDAVASAHGSNSRRDDAGMR